MPEMRKEELSEKLNNILGLDVEFTKMNKKDLVMLFNALSKEIEENTDLPEFWKRPLKELNIIKENETLADLTIIDIFQRIFPFPIFKKRSTGGGIFGLGILPFRLEWPQRGKKP